MTKKYICCSCHSTFNSPKERSSIGGALIWLVFIFLSMGLALIFYVFRKKDTACPICKNSNFIPIKSPNGQKLLKEIQR